MSRELLVGKHLAVLREQAGYKQNELAKKLEWSAAVLSRVENGERPLADDELEIILNGIGGDGAERLRAQLSRHWQILPEPALGDPDADLLWEAEQSVQKIHALSEQPDVKQFFERRLVRYKDEFAVAAQRVENKRFKVAFLGQIAVGKSTSICRAESLELPSTKGMPKAVLETGSGGITICEVHLRQGPGYGVIVEPCSEDEIRRHVTDFSNFLLNPSQPAQPLEDSDAETGSPGISREVERALRNMTGLKKKRSEKKSDGTIIPASDDARQLAMTVADSKALSVEILARMELHKRDRRDLWYSDEAGKSPLEWLQETFERINNGRHPEFTLPKRIELIIPNAVLGDPSLSITLIDTQGIDDIPERADLEQHFDDPHTVVVLCTLFNEAPSTHVRRLLTRAKEGGVRTLASHAAILALPRPGDALGMKDHDGYLVQSASDGYDLKADEVQLKLHPLGLTDIPVTFFNAAEDEPLVLRSFILSRIEAVREFHRQVLREIIQGANALLANYEKEQAREIMRIAARRLETWLDNNAELSATPAIRVHESLLTAISSAHPRTVFAAVVREGEWQNLDYAHQLSHGARRIATKVAKSRLSEFKAIAENLLQDEELIDAHDLVRQALRLLESGFDILVRKVQLVGQSIHADEMSADFQFWTACNNEWGRGGGYRDRINMHNRDWFEKVHQNHADVRVMEVIKATWREATESVRELLQQE
jgi:transcriptional regulator with XRE-family HTH domain